MQLTEKLFLAFSLIGLAGCGAARDNETTRSGLKRADFQTVVNGDSTDLYTLIGPTGMEVCITNYGGRVVSILVPDTAGKFRDVVLGYDHIYAYTVQPSSFGAVIGRFANRIAYGRFVLDGDTVQLDQNSGEHTIHGGSQGWRQQVWDAVQFDDSTLVLRYHSPDGESGFPGAVDTEITYRVTGQQELIITYTAQASERTVINLTNHSFFNLSGNPERTVLSDILYVNADRYTPLDSTLITTGALLPVTGTPFDFTSPASISENIARDSTHTQLKRAGGIDHNLVLNTAGDLRQLAARLYSPASGIALEVYTDEPGLQVYTGNMLDGSQTGKGGKVFARHGAICLETQHFPDSPNKPDWPSTILEPGQEYRSTCIYRFTTGFRNLRALESATLEM